MNKVKISVVSYLNSKPFVFGLKQHAIAGDIELALDIPADCARKMINGKADVGLVPVASIPLITNCSIITNYCISANNNVASVLLLSQKPLREIRTVVLDYQSMTSVTLVKILAREYWDIQPMWVAGAAGFEKTIANEQAAVVIGDRALELKDQFAYSYDLACEWKKFTHLPFVFACWVCNKTLPTMFIKKFEKALQIGVENIPYIASELAPHYPSSFKVKEYLTTNIAFDLTHEKRKALHLFLNKMKGIVQE